MKFSSFHPPTSSNLPSAELQSSNFSQLPPAYLSQPLPEKCRSTSVETDKPVPNIMNSSSSKAVEDKGNVKNTYRLNLLPPPQKQLRSQRKFLVFITSVCISFYTFLDHQGN